MRQLTLEDIQSTDVDEAPLTAIPGVGPVIEESLREGGFETRSDVLEASMDELVQLRRIGESTAKALLEGGEGQ